MQRDLAALAERFGLPPLGELVPLTGGYKNVLLRSGDVVVRVEETVPEAVAWEHELLSFLASGAPEVVLPLRAPDGTSYAVLGTRVVSFLPYVEGTAADRDDGAVRAAVARLLARLHRRGLEWPETRPHPLNPGFAELDWERNHWWDRTIADLPSALERSYRLARAWVDDAPALRRGAVHGDLYRGNVLTSGSRIVGVVDWEHARVEWLAWELANTTWELCKDERRDSLDRERAEAFVGEYLDAGGPAETSSFLPLLRVRLVADCLYSLTRKAEGGAWDPDYVAHLLRALDRLGEETPAFPDRSGA